METSSFPTPSPVRTAQLATTLLFEDRFPRADPPSENVQVEHLNSTLEGQTFMSDHNETGSANVEAPTCVQNSFRASLIAVNNNRGVVVQQPYQSTPGKGLVLSPLTGVTGGGFKKKEPKLVKIIFTFLQLSGSEGTIFGISIFNAYFVRDYLKKLGGNLKKNSKKISFYFFHFFFRFQRYEPKHRRASSF